MPTKVKLKKQQQVGQEINIHDSFKTLTDLLTGLAEKQHELGHVVKPKKEEVELVVGDPTTVEQKLAPFKHVDNTVPYPSRAEFETVFIHFSRSSLEWSKRQEGAEAFAEHEYEWLKAQLGNLDIIVGNFGLTEGQFENKVKKLLQNKDDHKAVNALSLVLTTLNKDHPSQEELVKAYAELDGFNGAIEWAKQDAQEFSSAHRQAVDKYIANELFYITSDFEIDDQTHNYQNWPNLQKNLNLSKKEIMGLIETALRQRSNDLGRHAQVTTFTANLNKLKAEMVNDDAPTKNDFIAVFKILYSQALHQKDGEAEGKTRFAEVAFDKWLNTLDEGSQTRLKQYLALGGINDWKTVILNKIKTLDPVAYSTVDKALQDLKTLAEANEPTKNAFIAGYTAIDKQGNDNKDAIDAFAKKEYDWLQQDLGGYFALNKVLGHIAVNKNDAVQLIKSAIKQQNAHADVNEKIAEKLKALQEDYPPKKAFEDVFDVLQNDTTLGTKRFAEVQFGRIKHLVPASLLSTRTNAIKGILANKADSSAVSQFVRHYLMQPKSHESTAKYLEEWGFDQQNGASSEVQELAKTFFAHTQFQRLLTDFNDNPLVKKILIDNKNTIIAPIKNTYLDENAVDSNIKNHLQPLTAENPSKIQFSTAYLAVELTSQAGAEAFAAKEYKWLQKQKFGAYFTADVPKDTLDYIHPDKTTAHRVIKDAIAQCDDHKEVEGIKDALDSLASSYSSALTAFAPLKAMGKLYPEDSDHDDVLLALKLILVKGAKEPNGVVAFLTEYFVTPADADDILTKVNFATALGLNPTNIVDHTKAINFLYGCYLQNQLAKDQVNVEDIKKDPNNQWLTQFEYGLTSKTVNLLNLDSDEGIAFARSLGQRSTTDTISRNLENINNAKSKVALETLLNYQDANPNPINQAAARLASEMFFKKVRDAVDNDLTLKGFEEQISKAPNGKKILECFWYQVRYDKTITSVDLATNWLKDLASPDPRICATATKQFLDFFEHQLISEYGHIPSDKGEVGKKYGVVYNSYPGFSLSALNFSLPSYNLLQDWLEPTQNKLADFPAIAQVLKTNSIELAELRLSEPQNAQVKELKLSSPERKGKVLEDVTNSDPKSVLEVVYADPSKLGEGHPSYEDYQRYLIAHRFPGSRHDRLGLASTGTITKQLAAAAYADRLVNALKEAATKNEPHTIIKLLKQAFELHVPGTLVPHIGDEELAKLILMLKNPLFGPCLSQMFAQALVNETLNVLVSKDVFEKKGPFSLLNPTPLMLERFDKLMDPNLTQQGLSRLMQKMGFEPKDADILARAHFGRVQAAEFNERFLRSDRLTTKEDSIKYIFETLFEKASIKDDDKRLNLIRTFMQANGVLASELGDLLLAKDLNLQGFTAVIEALVGKNTLAPKDIAQLFEQAKRLGNFEQIHNDKLRKTLRTDYYDNIDNPKKNALPDQGAAGNYALQPEIEKQIHNLNELAFSSNLGDKDDKVKPTLEKDDKVKPTLEKAINVLANAGMEIPDDIAKKEKSASNYTVEEDFVIAFNKAQKNSHAFRVALGVVKIDEEGVPIPLPLEQRSPGFNQFLKIARTHQWKLNQDILKEDFPKKPPKDTAAALKNNTDEYEFLAQLNELKNRLLSGNLDPSPVVASKLPIAHSYDAYVHNAKQLSFDELLGKVIDDYDDNKLTRHEKRILTLGEHAATLRDDKGLRKILDTSREHHQTDSVSLTAELTYYKELANNPKFAAKTETNLETCEEIQKHLATLKTQLAERRYQCRLDANLDQELGPETKGSLSQKSYQQRKAHWQQIESQYQQQEQLLLEAEKAVNTKIQFLQDLNTKCELITRANSWFTDNLIAVFGEEEGNPLTNPEVLKNMLDKMNPEQSLKVSFNASNTGEKYSTHLTTGRQGTAAENKELNEKKNPLVAFLPCKDENSTVCFTNKVKSYVTMFDTTVGQKRGFFQTDMGWAKNNIEALLSTFQTLASGSKDFTVRHIDCPERLALWRALYQHMYGVTQGPRGDANFDAKALKEVDKLTQKYLANMPKLLEPFDLKIETTHTVKGKEKTVTTTDSQVQQNLTGGIETTKKHGQEHKKQADKTQQEHGPRFK